MVDDETLVRETVGSLLADEGYVVDQATDGTDAIAKINAHRPDAILLDLMMPGMNGRQFLDALRDLGHGDVPVVVMTAVQGLAQGVFPQNTDVIEKPFDLDDLLNKIALAVYRSHGSHAPVTAVARDEVPTPVRGAAAAPGNDRGVVLLVDRDREALQRLDSMLSERGYTVVSMTRVTPQLPRLARALEPRAIILDLDSSDDETGTSALVQTLRQTAGLEDVPILVFARARVDRTSIHGITRSPDGSRIGDVTAVVQPVDEDLLRFVERSGIDR